MAEKKKQPAAKRKIPASKKSAAKPKSKKKPAPVPAGPGLFRRVMVCCLFVLVCLGIGAGYYLATHLVKPYERKPVPPLKNTKFEKPDFEIFPAKPLPKPKPVPVPVPPDRLPQVAIIIDDLGYDRELARAFLSLGGRLTFAILPNSPAGREIAVEAHGRGHEIMLHLPMEPVEFPKVDPGPGALLSAMEPDERIRLLKENISAIPFISGVNNHMGSRVTADSAQMNQILSIVRKQGLYFIDSRTTAVSTSRSSAKLFQVPFAERDIFLDHEASAPAIKKQLQQLIRIAEKNGQALGIGHPYQATYEVLAEMLPQYRNRVQFIPASGLVRVIES